MIGPYTYPGEINTSILFSIVSGETGEINARIPLSKCAPDNAAGYTWRETIDENIRFFIANGK